MNTTEKIFLILNYTISETLRKHNYDIISKYYQRTNSLSMTASYWISMSKINGRKIEIESKTDKYQTQMAMHIPRSELFQLSRKKIENSRYSRFIIQYLPRQGWLALYSSRWALSIPSVSIRPSAILESIARQTSHPPTCRIVKTRHFIPVYRHFRSDWGEICIQKTQ